MPKEAFRGAVRRLVVEGGARLVEVLPRQEYEDAHLRGAINIPLKESSTGRPLRDSTALRRRSFTATTIFET